MSNLSSTTNRSLVSSTRPLPNISKFVVEALPDRLRSIPGELAAGHPAEWISAEIGGLMQRDLPALAALSCEKEKRLALLDLMLIYNGLTKVGCPVPQVVLDASAQLGSELREPTWLTYGLIVRANPFSDTRSFTGSKTEKEFYRYHELIEKAMRPVMENLQIIMKDFEGVAIGQGTFAGQRQRLGRHFQESREKLFDEVHEALRWFISEDLDIGEFNQFRTFLIDEPARPGASGMFSGQMQAFSLALAGGRLGPALARVEKFLPFHPKENIGVLEWGLKAAQTGRSLADHLGQPGVDKDVIIECLDIFKAQLTFLGLHRTSILRALKPLYEANVVGTGGQPMKMFIDGTIRAYQDTIAEIEKLL